MKARLPLTAALVAALFPLNASAQAWVPNPDYSEGIGIRAGNLELHPSIGAEAGYDSNLFRSSGNGDGERVVDVWKFRVTPSLTLSTLGQKRLGAPTAGAVRFSGGAFASFYQPIAVDSENSEVSKRRNVALGANVKLDIFPQNKVGFDIVGAYLRTPQTEGRSDDLAGEGFNRDTLRGGGGVTWRPGGGLFEWRMGYLGTYNFFENETYDSLTNVHHDFNSRGRWRFLPRSALLFEGNYTLVRYTKDTQLTDGDAVRARLGFHGLVTYHLALMGMLGWGASFYKPHAGAIEPRQFDSLLANAEARWFIQPRPDLDSASVATGLSSVALGYARTFSNSYYGSFYQRDRGYAQASMFLLGALAGGIEFGVSRVAYPEVATAEVQRNSVSQLRLDGLLFMEYRLTDTFALNGTLQYDQVNSGPLNGEDLDYKRWQAYVGVRWFM
jgi:hypothetical protein